MGGFEWGSKGSDVYMNSDECMYVLVYEQDLCKPNQGISVDCIMSHGHTTHPGIGREMAREHVIVVTL
jgi:hypothetical protein